VVVFWGVPPREADLELDAGSWPRKFGKYHLLGPLAQGGMGALYLAVAGDRGLERLMVIKTVLPHLADAEYVARFRDEAKVVIKLSHGNLIPVFDAGLVGGELFLAMDFVEGRDLRAVWNRCAKKQVAFPIDVAVYIVKELCRGLGYAHGFPDLNLVHRDVSPPNVLVSYTGEVKLTDFGLASSTLKLEKTAPGIIYGKVAYMSPEQARGEKLDGRSDMYAAAIVLWELLTGRQLFPPGKDQPQDLLARAKNPEVMRPSKKAPRVPVELDEICLKALAPERAGRYGTCDEMRQALQAWLAQNAPTTDGSRMASFLSELFSDDIVRERTERQDLIARVRTRALTLPPTDELRIMVERSDRVMPPRDDEENTNVDAPVRKPGSIGRRTEDRGDRDNDRRNQGDRRLGRSPLSASDASGAAAMALAEAQPAETETDLIGVEVDGRYRVLELIGEGGMGKVYLAEHVEIGKRVALKVLHPSYSRMPDLVERFRREARAASKIGHPNIVDVTDSGTTAAGSVYFVMEYLEGVELGSVIEREGAINVERALKIATQICRALAAAHAQGIVHRDLKPENVFLITRDGAADVVKVLDFGIAKTTEAEAARERRLTSPGMAMGTPEYMAPEQAAGRPADARCDIYALGAIMYEMVTGLPPYSGDNFMEILTKKATIDPPPPITIRSELPPQVSDLVMQSMARSPDSRPQTMEGLEYELNKCLAGRGIAVAQILGMTTDATLVANLNPGLSVRNLDSEGTVSRAPTSSAGIGLPRAGTNQELWETRSGVSNISTTGQMAAPRPTSEPTATALASSPTRALSPEPVRLASQVSEASISLAPKRGALGVFGWLLLAAILFGGVGALLYVALGERGERGERPKVEGALTNGVGSNVASNVAPNVASGTADPHTVVAPGSGSTEVKPPNLTPDGSGVAPMPPVVNPPNAHIKVAPKAPPVDKTIKHPPVASTAADDTSAKALIDRGKALEKRNEWEQARGVYSKLEKVKGYGPESLYLQAYAAFGAHQLDDALQLAKKAAEQLTGQRKTDAQFLYGDALYRQNEFSRAKDIYMGLRKRLQGEQKTTAAKKVAACNKALHLADNDGLDD